MSIEVIPNRLYFKVSTTVPMNSPHAVTFTTDYVFPKQDFVYQPIYRDFGPLHLGLIYRYCQWLEDSLRDPKHLSRQLHHCAYPAADKLPNAILLMCAFQVLVLRRSVTDAWARFAHVQLTPFRDASAGPVLHDCTVLHCLQALAAAVRLDWFNYSTFDVDNYELHAARDDVHWIVPGRMLAFSAPGAQFPVRDYVRVLKALQVRAVVRLSEPTYDAQEFTAAGLTHFDLFFPDGSSPTPPIVAQFSRIVNSQQVVAVHCKAGLGRTGTLIGCYAIANYSILPDEYIAWARLCRPGSVLGPQQRFLQDFAQGPRRSLNQYERYRDCGQADRLLEGKRLQSRSSVFW